MYVHYLLQEPLLAVSCHQPGTNMGRCRAERIRQTFGHPYASALNPHPTLTAKLVLSCPSTCTSATASTSTLPLPLPLIPTITFALTFASPSPPAPTLALA